MIPKMSAKRIAAMNDGTYNDKYRKVKRPTGELALLDRLIKERGPYSEISTDNLLPKGSDKYHWQLFHILGKGEYPELRLEESNILLCTWQEQDAWTQRKWTLRDKPQWKAVFEKEAELKAAARGVSE